MYLSGMFFFLKIAIMIAITIPKSGSGLKMEIADRF